MPAHMSQKPRTNVDAICTDTLSPAYVPRRQCAWPIVHAKNDGNPSIIVCSQNGDSSPSAIIDCDREALSMSDTVTIRRLSQGRMHR